MSDGPGREMTRVELCEAWAASRAAHSAAIQANEDMVRQLSSLRARCERMERVTKAAKAVDEARISKRKMDAALNELCDALCELEVLEEGK